MNSMDQGNLPLLEFLFLVVIAGFAAYWSVLLILLIWRLIYRGVCWLEDKVLGPIEDSTQP